jgi:hypothetical protein
MENNQQMLIKIPVALYFNQRLTNQLPVAGNLALIHW